MTILILAPGEEITIQFKDSDGEIKVSFGMDAIRVESDLPDTTGRVGLIYEEQYGDVGDFRELLAPQS